MTLVGQGTSGQRSTVVARPEELHPAGNARQPVDPDRSPGDAGKRHHPRREALAHGARVALLMVAAVSVGMALNLVLLSRLEQNSTQYKELSQFRYELATGTGPIGPVRHGQPLALGTPMALITIPAIGVKQVVDEGTNGAVLRAGPGHLPSTVFPGGLGTSVIYGRASTYGGPFARVPQLRPGDRIFVTVQNGPKNSAQFRVTDVRTAGQRIPRIGSGGSRLTLVTATESKFVPSGAVYVDANIVGSALPTPPPVLRAQNVPADELPLGVDTSQVWVVALWLLVLALGVSLAVWTWHRKGHARAWIIFAAPVVVIGYFLADQIATLLPNVM
jgi:sortase A